MAIHRGKQLLEITALMKDQSIQQEESNLKPYS